MLSTTTQATVSNGKMAAEIIESSTIDSNGLATYSGTDFSSVKDEIAHTLVQLLWRHLVMCLFIGLLSVCEDYIWKISQQNP